jgi:hypothetical protein
VDWTGIIGGIVGGVIGVAGGVAATIIGNRGALKRSREERLDARHGRSYLEVLTAAHAVDRLARDRVKSDRGTEAAFVYADDAVNVPLQRARAYTMFGSREIEALYDDVISLLLEFTAQSSAATHDDYQRILDVVTALDKAIPREMALAR